MLDNLIELYSSFALRNIQYLSQISFSMDNIAKMVRSLDLMKLHGHNIINIQMIKIFCPTCINPSKSSISDLSKTRSFHGIGNKNLLSGCCLSSQKSSSQKI